MTRPTVYTRLSNHEQTLFSGWRFPSGNEHVPRKDEPQGSVSCFADPDARSDANVSNAKAVVANPQARTTRRKIASVVARARDAESFGQSARTTRESNEVARLLHLDVSSSRHFFNALKRLDGAEKNSPGLAFAITRYVEAIVIAVDEINVGVAGRSEENRVARGLASIGVRGGIVLSEVSLDLDDPARQPPLPALPNQHLAQQLASYTPRTAREE